MDPPLNEVPHFLSVRRRLVERSFKIHKMVMSVDNTRMCLIKMKMGAMAGILGLS